MTGIITIVGTPGVTVPLYAIQSSSYITAVIPIEMRGALFTSARFSYHKVVGSRIADSAIRHDGTATAVTDASIVDMLNADPDMESFRMVCWARAFSVAQSGDLGQRSVSWQNVQLEVDYTPSAHITGTADIGDGYAEYALYSRSAAPGERVKVYATLHPDAAVTGCTVALTDEDGEVCGSAHADVSAPPGSGTGFSVEIDVQDISVQERVSPAGIRFTVEGPGGTVAGEISTTSMNLVSERIAPDGETDIEDTGTAYSSTGAFVQLHSSIRVVLTPELDTQADDEIAIVKRKLTLMDELGREWVYDGATDNIDVGTLDANGTITYSLKITDSYGAEGTVSGSFYLTPWRAPKLTGLEISRYIERLSPGGESEYIKDDYGEHVWFSCEGLVYAINGANAWTITLDYSDGTETETVTLMSGSDGEEISVSEDRDAFSETLDPNKRWSLVVTLADLFDSSVYMLELIPATALLSIEDGGVAVGMVARREGSGAFDVAYPTFFHSSVTMQGDAGWTELTLTGCTRWTVDTPVRALRRYGLIHLSGSVKLTSILGSGSASNITITTLPEGMRPAYRHTLPIVLHKTNGYIQAVIGTDGTVTLWNYSGYAVETSLEIPVDMTVPVD